MGTAAELLRDRIAAEESYAAIEYGRRALEATGGRGFGCTREFGAAGWAIAQFEAGILEAAIAIGKDDLDDRDLTDGAAWIFKRGKKIAAERLKAAKAALSAAGTRNQLRLAIALAA